MKDYRAIIIGICCFALGQTQGGVWDDVKKASLDMKESIDSKVDALMAPTTDNTAEIIEKIEGYAPKFIETRRNQEAAPTKKLIGKDKSDYEREAQKQLEDIQELLFDKKILGQSERIKLIEDKIKSLETELSSLRKQKVDALAVNNEAKVTEIDEDINDIQENKVNALKDEIKSIKKDIQSKFAKMGSTLSDDQVDLLCDRVDGDDILKAMTMIDVFKQILERTKNYIEADPENLETTKKYYGVYVLIAEANVYAKTVYIDKVNEEWLLMLDVFKKQADVQVRACKAEIKAAQDERIAARYRANLEINEMSKSTIELYRKMLVEQRQKAEEARRRARAEAKLAWSTYETASLSADLIGMINEADKAFNDVMKIEMPELIPIEDSEIKNSFVKLTTRLKANQ